MGSTGTARRPRFSGYQIAKPLCLCKNDKFVPSNAKFVKMHKSNAKLLESNFLRFLIKLKNAKSNCITVGDALILAHLFPLPFYVS